jgi:hypothetical protein
MLAGMENNKILGIVLIVLGALLLLGWLHIPYLGLILGVLLLVVGIMTLMGKFSGANWMAWVLIVLGAIAVLANLGLNFLDSIANILVTIVAIILIVFGVLKLVGK